MKPELRLDIRLPADVLERIAQAIETAWWTGLYVGVLTAVGVMAVLVMVGWRR